VPAKYWGSAAWNKVPARGTRGDAVHSPQPSAAEARLGCVSRKRHRSADSPAL